MEKFHKDQKGAAMVLVIVSVALVSLLAIVILTVTMANLRMKIINQRSKENFYSAEVALDEIKTGLEKEISVQMTRAYLNVVENYGNWKAQSENEGKSVLEQMRKNFVSDYLAGLRKELRKNNNDMSYDVEKLKSYLVNAKDAKLSGADGTDDFRLMTTEKGIILKNLKVTYTDNMAYTSVITTDIVLGIPDMEFTMAETIPSFMDFALIADDALSLNSGSILTVSGNVYGGHGGIYLGGGSALNVEASDLVITDKEISMETGSRYRGSTGTTLWCEGLTLLGNSVEASLGGRTYIKDDLTVEGSNSKVFMGTEYYGYGNVSDRAAGSSAIVVNGRETTLDMSELNVLMLAGNAFVTTSRSDTQAKPTDTRTGSSVSVKSDQLAYLIPDTCGELTSNPMSSSQFNLLTADSEWKNKILDTPLNALNRTLRDYGVKDIIEYHTSVNGKAQVYLYTDFENTDRAAEYFADFYSDSADGEEINKYLNLFVSNISSPDNFTRLDVAGNYLVRDESGLATVRRPGISPDNGERLQEILTYQQMFDSYTKILSAGSTNLTEDEKGKGVFDNLMSINTRQNYRLREYMDTKKFPEAMC